jgi:CRISPR/Cas system-associated exonuclease Cas4 (RecB family)
MRKEGEEQTDLQRQAACCTERFCVVSGSPGTGKTWTLCERALRLVKEFERENVLVITPHPVSARNIFLRLKTSGAASCPRVLDIFSFGREVISDNYQRARFVSALGRFLILRRVSHSIQFISRLREHRHAPGFVESLSQIVAMMRDAGVTGDSLQFYMSSGSADDVLRDLATILGEYEKILSEKKLFDRQKTIGDARELVETEKVTLPRHILIDDLQDFSSVELRLVQPAVQQCESAFFAVDTFEGSEVETQIFSQLLPQERPKVFAFDKRFGAFASLPGNQNAVETHFFADRLSESLWIADKITELKNKPEAAGATFIVLAQNTDSLSLFCGEFERRRIPFFAAPHHFLSRGAHARATLSLLGALTETPQRHIIEPLRLPLFSVSDEVLNVLRERFEKEDPLPLLRSISGGTQTGQISSGVSLTAREREAIATLVSILDSLSSRKESLRLREVVDAACKLICEVNPLLSEFADEFDLCFESGTSPGSLYELVSECFGLFSASGADELSGALVESDRNVDLQILLPEEISCAQADFVFAAELQEGAFTPDRVRILLPEEQAAIERAASGLVQVFPARTSKDQREYLFKRCASVAKRKPFLSCHRSEPGREFLPSSLLCALFPDCASQKLEAFSGFGADLKIPATERRSQTGATVSLAQNFTLSATSINTYLACPRMFYFAYILGIPEPFVSPNMVIGSMLHAVMKELRQPGSAGGLRDIEKAKEILERELSSRSQDFRTDAELEGARRRCHHILNEYLQFQDDWQSEVNAVEKEFFWKFRDFLLTGRIDRVDKTGGRFEIVDYKLTGDKKGRGLKNRFLVEKKDFQLPVYYWAAREALGLDVSAFSYVVFDFKKTGRPEKVTLRFCEQGRTDEVILPSQMENAKERLAEIIDEISRAHEDFPIGEKAPCTEGTRGCTYRSICVKAQH